MAQLIYTANTSLDGYVNDADGNFDFTVPSDEVHGFINDLERGHGTYLYGRRLYETMKVWEAMQQRTDLSPVARDYADFWCRAQKVVYSRTLKAAETARTRIEPSFDPEAVRRLKAGASTDLSLGGAELAGQAFAAGLVDQVHLFLAPVIIGGGTRALPDAVRTRLELLDERTFGSGVVHLHYRVSGQA
ncbi:deaminase [Arthrobacter livingstonensis]|uniref:Deaminase n=1 Tax=Arthrobacter livingstonensis TaxID=670078 RepID=A0A2V5LBK4_9MICC|nr:dihydrofolate reductase family protein [Arthrobacter livingstonensis]PYI67924.1 deaminase [Arthrobacter livingstonensis]